MNFLNTIKKLHLDNSFTLQLSNELKYSKVFNNKQGENNLTSRQNKDEIRSLLKNLRWEIKLTVNRRKKGKHSYNLHENNSQSASLCNLSCYCKEHNPYGVSHSPELMLDWVNINIQNVTCIEIKDALRKIQKIFSQRSKSASKSDLGQLFREASRMRYGLSSRKLHYQKFLGNLSMKVPQPFSLKKMRKHLP